MPQTSGRWRALPQHPVTGCGNFSGRSRESRRQLDHKTLRAAATRPIFQAYFGQSGRNSGHRQQDPILALETVSQDGSARRRNARLSVPAQGGGTSGRSQAPARGLLGSLAGFGKAGPTLGRKPPRYPPRHGSSKTAVRNPEYRLEAWPAQSMSGSGYTTRSDRIGHQPTRAQNLIRKNQNEWY